MKKQMIINGSVLVVVAVAAFFGGSAYGKMHALQTRTAGNFMMNGAQRGQFGTGGTRSMMGGAVAGTILSKDDKSITIKLANGGSRIVLLSPSTPVLKTTPGTNTDLTVGAQVFASGTANADGSITAQSVSLGTLTGFGQRGAQSPQR